jgi:hypothetical protein
MGKKRNTRTKPATKNPKAYTLDTAIVKDYIVYVAVREMGLVGKIMPEDCQSEAQFCVKHGLSARSVNTLHNYVNIKGFWEAVDKEKRQYKHLLLDVGMRGLLKLAEGCDTTKKTFGYHGRGKNRKKGLLEETIEHILPHEKACERLVQLGGGDIKDKIVTEGSVAAAFREAAKAEAEGEK